MNLYLHDIETFSIRRGDTLRDPRFRETDGSLTRFDMVIANPPFSLRNWGRGGWADDPFGRSTFGVPPDSFGDLAFVEHMLASMSPTSGRLAVVMPHGALFRGGAERGIRQSIIEAGVLEAVIGLPPNLFYSTSIPAAVLVCRTQPKPDRANQVLFVDASARFRKLRNQNEMAPADVDVVATAYRTGQDPDGEGGVFVRLVPVDELQSNGWDLNLSRYVETGAAEEVQVGEALAAYLDSRDQLLEAEAVLDERLREAGFLV